MYSLVYKNVSPDLKSAHQGSLIFSSSLCHWPYVFAPPGSHLAPIGESIALSLRRFDVFGSLERSVFDPASSTRKGCSRHSCLVCRRLQAFPHLVPGEEEQVWFSGAWDQRSADQHHLWVGVVHRCRHMVGSRRWCEGAICFRYQAAITRPTPDGMWWKTCMNVFVMDAYIWAFPLGDFCFLV